MSITITGPHDLIKPLLANGQPNQLFGLAAYLAVRATGKDNDINVDVVNNQARITGITDVSALDVTTIGALVAAGAEVQGWPVWIALDDDGLAEQVPNYVPNHSDEQDAPRTWAEWHDESHAIMTIDGTHYVPGNAWGSELLGSVIVALASGGFTIKTLPQMQAIVAEASQGE